MVVGAQGERRRRPLCPPGRSRRGSGRGSRSRAAARSRRPEPDDHLLQLADGEHVVEQVQGGRPGDGRCRQFRPQIPGIGEAADRAARLLQGSEVGATVAPICRLRNHPVHLFCSGADPTDAVRSAMSSLLRLSTLRFERIRTALRTGTNNSCPRLRSDTDLAGERTATHHGTGRANRAFLETVSGFGPGAPAATGPRLQRAALARPKGSPHPSGSRASGPTMRCEIELRERDRCTSIRSMQPIVNSRNVRPPAQRTLGRRRSGTASIEAAGSPGRSAPMAFAP